MPHLVVNKLVRLVQYFLQCRSYSVGNYSPPSVEAGYPAACFAVMIQYRLWCTDGNVQLLRMQGSCLALIAGDFVSQGDQKWLKLRADLLWTTHIGDTHW